MHKYQVLYDLQSILLKLSPKEHRKVLAFLEETFPDANPRCKKCHHLKSDHAEVYNHDGEFLYLCYGCREYRKAHHQMVNHL